MTETERCPSCKGKGEIAGIAITESGCCGGPQALPCFDCEGSKTVPAGYAARRALGDRLKSDRLVEKKSLGQKARELGIDVVTLSRRERGFDVAWYADQRITP